MTTENDDNETLVSSISLTSKNPSRMSFLPLFLQKVSLIGIALGGSIWFLREAPRKLVPSDERYTFDLITNIINPQFYQIVLIISVWMFVLATIFKYIRLWRDPESPSLEERIESMPNPKRWSKWGNVTSAFVAIFVFYHVIQGSSLLENWLESQ